MSAARQVGVLPCPAGIVGTRPVVGLVGLLSGVLALVGDVDCPGVAELDEDPDESDDREALPLALQPVRAMAIIPPPQARAPVVRRRLNCIGKCLLGKIPHFEDRLSRCP
jgi:hypothetical protein